MSSDHYTQYIHSFKINEEHNIYGLYLIKIQKRITKNHNTIFSGTNVTSKPKGIQKSIFLKRQNNTSETIDSKKCDQSGFKFNFDVSERLENSEKEPKEEEISEDLVQVERFKLEKSDNSFRFNFSMN